MVKFYDVRLNFTNKCYMISNIGNEIVDLCCHFNLAVYNERKETPITRMATAALIREQLSRALEYRDKQDKAQEDQGEDMPDFDAKLEALSAVASGDLPAHFHAHRADDIATAVRIAKEFRLNYVLVHATEGYLVADILARGEDVDRCIRLGQDRTEADREFHAAIVRATHNSFMMRLLPMINQAVAAAKLGAPTYMIARVGDDAFGEQMRRSLEGYGVNCDYLSKSTINSTGVAIITRCEGDNRIILSSGANYELTGPGDSCGNYCNNKNC